MKNSIWYFPEQNEQDCITFTQLRSKPELSLIPDRALNFLISRGFTDSKTIYDMFYQNLDHLYDFNLMKDAPKALRLLKTAIKNKERIMVVADYDMDGMGAGAISVLGIRELGGIVDHHTNNRFVEGYGLKPATVDRVLERYPDTKVILTVDNGISAYEGVLYAKRKGLTVIVTDHHDANEVVPEADAVIDPKQHDCPYPFKELCGAGIAFKLVRTLAWELGAEMDFFDDLVDIASLSTVADVVPLVSENRIIVKEGLKRVKEGRRSFFRYMKEAAQPPVINEETFGFTYGPMLNAHGRIDGNVGPIIETIITQDEQWQQQMCQYLVEMNNYRKSLTETQKNFVLELLKPQMNEPIFIVKHPSLHEGLVGLIAGYIKEEFYKPVFVLTEHNGVIKGSARSIPGFHLKKELDKCEEFLAGYGGHAPAAGLTIKEGCYEQFVEAMQKQAREVLTPELLTQKVKINMALNEHELNFGLLEELDLLRPYGAGFEKPIIALKDVSVVQADFIGQEKQHLKLRGQKLDILLFNQAQRYANDGSPYHLHILGYPSINTFRGNVTLQFLGSEYKNCNIN